MAALPVTRIVAASDIRDADEDTDRARGVADGGLERRPAQGALQSPKCRWSFVVVELSGWGVKRGSSWDSEDGTADPECLVEVGRSRGPSLAQKSVCGAAEAPPALQPKNVAAQ